MYKKKIKTKLSIYKKGLQLFTKYVQCPLDHSVLHLYTIKNVHTSTVFFHGSSSSLSDSSTQPSILWMR